MYPQPASNSHVPLVELEHFLQSVCPAVGFTPDAVALRRFVLFAERMLEVNETMNLTRITAPDGIAVRHFADSLTVLQAVPDLPTGAEVADVGTGAGFPGMVLKIARPDLKVTLIDSLAKRLGFLHKVASELQLESIRLVHARAEEAGREPSHRERYDLVTARAVAPLPILLEWCSPLVRVGGLFVAMKSELVDEELHRSEPARAALRLSRAGVVSLELPAAGSEPATPRKLLVYTKEKATPPRFPRATAEIKARPLERSQQ